jgi:branched-chain amino acid transport system ATP-binding protein
VNVALDCRAISVKFGHFTAVDNFSFAFERNRIYAIIGPNGAGKTTLMNAIVGRQKLAGGAIFLDNRDITRLPIAERARHGLGRSFQVTKIFAGMSVFENLRLAAQVLAFKWQPFWLSATRFPGIADAATAMLLTVGLEAHRDVDADKLSHGDQRALELGLALMTKPSVLLLDEPLAGIGHHELSRTADLLGKISQGRTVLLIEHNMEAVMRLAYEVLVMVDGRLIAADKPDAVRSNPQVRVAYLGSEA